ncbi:uncharacterized protein MONBRDRAFT_34638 [Monosiga brevicollis MX1]|uniref:Selenoprotein O n=1 Tax=Monosiga brevicollis TaxID=81824 RepID=A9VD07_MONBE|nr:uncharacterized protein MONBRDRAFT_34638 [Monosiga brevicollis MX1]EDQ84595.1 predicted protein [Monosiga brevicollis MX1]|eukprot:XP_001750622.1 hypothetical protein [Monosiga brevicollis MX1]
MRVWTHRVGTGLSRHVQVACAGQPLSREFWGVVRQQTAQMANAAAAQATRKSGAEALAQLRFDNSALRELPVDPETKNFTRRVSGAFYSRVEPAPVENPQVVALSWPALELLGLTEATVQVDDDFVAAFAGNVPIPGAEYAAHCYCGHQFGYFSGQLGDGAAMYLGEVVNERNERWELQFKGAGLTPFSRQADGRKVLRSSIREFLCSEAMHALNIPTTRAGSLITSDTRVVRDIFYTGSLIQERATVITRLAPSFLRFGSFEVVKEKDPKTMQEGSSPGQVELTKKLLDYLLAHHFADIWSQDSSPEDKFAEFLAEVTRRTAALVAQWQCVGWCHGVLNTDNMSVLGLTIDYGPFGFMEQYDPNFICNRSDDGGRYDYQSQPEICRWNLHRLADVLVPHLPLERARDIIDRHYTRTFEQAYMDGMRAKLGLLYPQGEDQELIKALFTVMAKTSADFTNTFRLLSRFSIDDQGRALWPALREQLYPLDVQRLLSKPRIPEDQMRQLLAMPQLAEMIGLGAGVLNVEQRKSARFKELQQQTQEAMDEDNLTHWQLWFNKYAARLQVDNDTALKQDQMARDAVESRRRQVMDEHNPSFVLRNHVAQTAIAKAEQGDFSEVQRVLEELRRPFAEREDLQRAPQEQKHGFSAPAFTDPHQRAAERLHSMAGLPFVDLVFLAGVKDPDGAEAPNQRGQRTYLEALVYALERADGERTMRCLAFISHLPLWYQQRAALRYVYEQPVRAQAKLLNTILSLRVYSRLSIYRPPLALLQAPFGVIDLLLQYLCPRDVVHIVLHAVLGRKIIVAGRHMTGVAHACAAIQQLMYPLSVWSVFIPNLPRHLVADVTPIPSQYLVGIHSDDLPLADVGDGIVVQLDDSQLQGSTAMDLPALPEVEQLILDVQFAQAYTTAINHATTSHEYLRFDEAYNAFGPDSFESDIARRGGDSTGTQHSSADDKLQAVLLAIGEGSLGARVRWLFLRFWTMLLKDFSQMFLFIGDPMLVQKDEQRAPIFNQRCFLYHERVGALLKQPLHFYIQALWAVLVLLASRALPGSSRRLVLSFCGAAQCKNAAFMQPFDLFLRSYMQGKEATVPTVLHLFAWTALQEAPNTSVQLQLDRTLPQTPVEDPKLPHHAPGEANLADDDLNKRTPLRPPLREGHRHYDHALLRTSWERAPQCVRDFLQLIVADARVADLDTWYRANLTEFQASVQDEYVAYGVARRLWTLHHRDKLATSSESKREFALSARKFDILLNVLHTLLNHAPPDASLSAAEAGSAPLHRYIAARSWVDRVAAHLVPVINGYSYRDTRSDRQLLSDQFWHHPLWDSIEFWVDTILHHVETAHSECLRAGGSEDLVTDFSNAARGVIAEFVLYMHNLGVAIEVIRRVVQETAEFYCKLAPSYVTTLESIIPAEAKQRQARPGRPSLRHLSLSYHRNSLVVDVFDDPTAIALLPDRAALLLPAESSTFGYLGVTLLYTHGRRWACATGNLHITNYRILFTGWAQSAQERGDHRVYASDNLQRRNLRSTTSSQLSPVAEEGTSKSPSSISAQERSDGPPRTSTPVTSRTNSLSRSSFPTLGLSTEDLDEEYGSDDELEDQMDISEFWAPTDSFAPVVLSMPLAAVANINTFSIDGMAHQRARQWHTKGIVILGKNFQTMRLTVDKVHAPVLADIEGNLHRVLERVNDQNSFAMHTSTKKNQADVSLATPPFLVELFELRCVSCLIKPHAHALSGRKTVASLETIHRIVVEGFRRKSRMISTTSDGSSRDSSFHSLVSTLSATHAGEHSLDETIASALAVDATRQDTLFSDFDRMNILGVDHSSGVLPGWRAVPNHGFRKVHSYPELFLLPDALDPSEEAGAMSAFVHNRIPILQWTNATTGAAILMGAACAQASCSSVQAFYRALLDLRVKPVRGQNAQGSQRLMDLKLQKLPVSKGSDAQPQIVVLGDNASTQDPQIPGVTFIDVTMASRPLITSVATIHEMARELSVLAAGLDTGSFWRDLDKIGWLTQVADLLHWSNVIADLCTETHAVVVIAMEHGCDAAMQLTSLAMLQLDTHYRQLDAFMAHIINRVWIQHGHPFAARAGLVAAKPSPRSAELSGVAGLPAPTFGLFLDCVYQMLSQFPAQFEFNAELLEAIFHHSYSARFGNFLCNDQAYRDRLGIDMDDLFAFVMDAHAKTPQYANLMYSACNAHVLRTNAALPMMQLWRQVYMPTPVLATNEQAGKGSCPDHVWQAAHEHAKSWDQAPEGHYVGLWNVLRDLATARGVDWAVIWAQRQPATPSAPPTPDWRLKGSMRGLNGRLLTRSTVRSKRRRHSSFAVPQIRRFFSSDSVDVEDEVIHEALVEDAPEVTNAIFYDVELEGQSGTGPPAREFAVSLVKQRLGKTFLVAGSLFVHAIIEFYPHNHSRSASFVLTHNSHVEVKDQLRRGEGAYLIIRVAPRHSLTFLFETPADRRACHEALLQCMQQSDA